MILRHCLGIVLLGQVHRALDVGEQHRHLLALAVSLDALRIAHGVSIVRPEATYTGPNKPIDWSVSHKRRGDRAVRVAAVQLNSTDDKARNLAAAERLVRAAAADGAELVALPEKWNLLASGEELAAGAEPLDGPSLARRPRLGARARHPPAGRQHRRAGRGREGVQHLGPDRARRRGPRRLPQDPHVRRRCRRRLLPRVRARAGGRRDRRRRRSPGCAAGADRLLRPALPRAVPDPRRARRPPDRRSLRLHRGHRPRPLGGRCCARGRSRTRSSSSPPTRSARRRPTTAPTGTRRSSTPGARCWRRPARRGVLRRRRPRPRRAGADPRERCPRSPTAAPRPTPGRSSLEAHA